jgi:site-specific DNA recombinase
MKRCFAYIRVSTVRQGDGASLDAQRDAIEAFASRHHLAITQWFEEKETAAKGGRPVFNKLVSELRVGRADGLIIYKIDRSARNLGDWSRIGELADIGVDIHFATETLDFRSRGGRLTADIQAVIAADFIRNLREETLKGIYARLKQGLYPFRAPIGYLDNGSGKPKTLDPLRAPLVKQAFELYATRTHSLRTLWVELQGRGLTTRQGKRLSLHGLETILNCTFYTGVIAIKRTGQTYHGIHERLISPALFERVQFIKSGKSGPKVTRHGHTYQGLFRCGHCAGPMVPELHKSHVYYRCKTTGCATKTIREEALAEAIETSLKNAALTEADEVAFHARIDAWVAKAGEQDEERTWQLRRANLADRIDRLTDALVDRLIEKDAFADRRKRLALEDEALNEERRELQNRASKADHLRGLAELAKSLHLSHQRGNSAEKLLISIES